MTQYVILRRVDQDEQTVPEGYWNPIGTGEGSNDLAAVRAFLTKGDNGAEYGEGEYRGVPLRSWQDGVHSIKRKVSFG